MHGAGLYAALCLCQVSSHGCCSLPVSHPVGGYAFTSLSQPATVPGVVPREA